MRISITGLNVVPINVPPLRERKEDIPFLAMHFVRNLRKDLASPVKEISPAAMDRLLKIPGRATYANWRTQLSEAWCWQTGTMWKPADIRIENAAQCRMRVATQAALLPEGGRSNNGNR